MCVVTQLSISPLFQHWCWACQAWEVSGIAADPVVIVLAWNGSRYPSGLLGSGCWNTDRPVGSLMALGSEKPRTPGKVPK